MNISKNAGATKMEGTGNFSRQHYYWDNFQR